MKLPVDDDTLNAWAKLLNLTEEQKAAALKEIEGTLRIGRTLAPIATWRRSLEEMTEQMEADELAGLFLVAGLRQTGHHEAADSVEVRIFIADVRAHFTGD